MRRIASVWLPMWPIERMRRHTPSAVPDDAPLALVESGARGIRITAVNVTAARHGVAVGSALADARAALPGLLSRLAEPEQDRAALLRLARWCGRYGPACNTDGDDGLWIDVTGVAHLFGGEETLLGDLVRRMARFRLTARVGLAGTLGTAHALARYGSPRRAQAPHAIAPPGAERDALAALPVEALRLDGETALLLKRLGLRRIGQLYALPRATLERRFSSEASSRSKANAGARLAAAVLVRLDQALGTREEPRAALRDPPALSRRCSWSEPLISSEALENETAALASGLCSLLEEAGLAATRIRLTLYRADGTIAEIGAGLSRPSRDPVHMMRLLAEKLASVDAGFGIDVAALDALSVEPLDAGQARLGHDRSQSSEAGIAALVDRLANRLGSGCVTSLAPVESHIPERAERRMAAGGASSSRVRSKGGGEGQKQAHAQPALLRPPFLLAEPEPITVMAEVPEGPPRRFTWRRMLHRIVKAEGPERIAPEWWRALEGVGTRRADGERQKPSSQMRPRDYYAIEDESGARFWVFREGLYQSAAEDGPPRWFLHGIF